jgi:hypothetical protein
MPTKTLAEVNTAARPTSEVRHRMVLRLLEKDPKSLLVPKLDYGRCFRSRWYRTPHSGPCRPPWQQGH